MAIDVFTGLVQPAGQLLTRSPRSGGFRLTFAHEFGPLELGESIAVNGVCLTVTTERPKQFDADASTETVSRSTLGALPIGSAVHLERALRVGDRFGGHIVAGHVDATAQLLATQAHGDAVELTFALPKSLRSFIAEKGSIAIDGVSLTVNRVTDAQFSLMVVPHTQQMTHLGSLRRGNAVNVEVDVIARYVAHLTQLANIDTIHHESHNEIATGAPDRDASLRQVLARAGIL